ncbi:MAG TPA: 30S ribosome-binding factor RbfA [Gemmatimonadaceae bacterium]|nr:30S ribosome-binding factor RbfA [Gemmatimonadaceae bacterium]
MAVNRRPDRVAEAIRAETAMFLTSGVKDPRVIGLVTVTGVDVARDLRSARIFVSILGSDAERAATMDGLASVAGHLRARLGKSLRLRSAPEISFKLDESIARAARIHAVLEQAHREDAALAEQRAASAESSPDGDAADDT